MREELLHYIWQYKKIPFSKLTTQRKEELQIVNFGLLNSGEGPDFLNARIRIDGQLWAGNVEMHLKSSDWYAHHHEIDANYDNVILHVVWKDDIAVFRRDKSQIPTLELQNCIPQKLLIAYEKLMDTSKTRFIGCENDIHLRDSLKWVNWEERLYFERLEQKSILIHKLFEQTRHDWEAVLFAMLCKSFGTKINGSFFLDQALSLDFAIVRKTSFSEFQLESLLFGHFGMLHINDCTDRYFLELKREYSYLSQKFDLSKSHTKPAFFRLRPNNFPTIRVSQLSNIYFKNHQLFQLLMEIEHLDEFYEVFQAYASPYWNNHFTFGKISKTSKKKLSRAFIDLLLINTLIPLKFCYAQYSGKDWNEKLLEFISKIGPEKNSIISGYGRLGVTTRNALESQARIQLYNAYCSKKRCLHCNLGVHLLNRNVYF
ncbi:DUF2851 family protein [Flagellimonas sp.]|uniref:DUF2851 family protein n=1 Tax=Flagellimonas sp. TaxID=2058762 RepID=UPI003F49C249